MIGEPRVILEQRQTADRRGIWYKVKEVDNSTKPTIGEALDEADVNVLLNTGFAVKIVEEA